MFLNFAKYKGGFLFPLMLFVSSAFGQTVLHGNVDWTKKLSFKGNSLTFNRPSTMMIGGITRTSNPAPIKLNNEHIFDEAFISEPPKITGYLNMQAYLRNAVIPAFAKLPDGNYVIETYYLIVDKNGKLVYFDFRPLTSISAKNTAIRTYRSLQQVPDTKPFHPDKDDYIASLEPSQIKAFDRYMYKVLSDAPRFKAGKDKNVNVNCLLSSQNNLHCIVIVRGHKVTLKD